MRRGLLIYLQIREQTRGKLFREIFNEALKVAKIEPIKATIIFDSLMCEFFHIGARNF
jgi:endo-1,4-beta-mannosidase